MADFPDTIYTERDTENLPGLVFDPTDKKNLYSEDFQRHASEIIAIQTILGTLPSGAYATVREWLEALSAGGGGGSWGSITGEISAQTDLQTALDSKVPYTGATQDLNLESWYIYAAYGIFGRILAQSGILNIDANNFINSFDLSAMSEGRNFTFPDKSGTIAFLDDVSAVDDKVTAINDLLGENPAGEYSTVTEVVQAFFDFYNSYNFYSRNVLQGQGMLTAPADSSTYYIGAPGFAPSSTKAFATIFYNGPAGYLNRVHIKLARGGTTATSENSSVYLVINSTETLLSNTVKMGYTQFIDLYFDSLDKPIAWGDTVCIKIVTPAWATNPTNVNVQMEFAVGDQAE
jgi:hypothetical protein